MATFYTVNTQTGETVKTSPAPFNVDENVQPDPPFVQLKRVDDNTVPVYAEATHKLVRSVTDSYQAHTRTFYNEVVEKTQAEKNAYQQRLADDADRAAAKAVLLDMKNGVGTQTVRTTRLEKVLFRVAKDLYGNS